MNTIIKRSCFLRLIHSSLLIILLLNPVSTAFASGEINSFLAQKTVTASAVVVLRKYHKLGFLHFWFARDVPVKEGDAVKAGKL